jgi:hypothetical protein
MTLYDNEYNREVNKRLHKIHQEHINWYGDGMDTPIKGTLRGGFLPFLPMIASAVAPSVLSFMAKKITGSGAMKLEKPRSRVENFQQSAQRVVGGGVVEDLRYSGGGGLLGSPSRIGYPKGTKFPNGDNATKTEQEQTQMEVEDNPIVDAIQGSGRYGTKGCGRSGGRKRDCSPSCSGCSCCNGYGRSGGGRSGGYGSGSGRSGGGADNMDRNLDGLPRGEIRKVKYRGGSATLLVPPNYPNQSGIRQNTNLVGAKSAGRARMLAQKFNGAGRSGGRRSGGRQLVEKSQMHGVVGGANVVELANAGYNNNRDSAFYPPLTTASERAISHNVKGRGRAIAGDTTVKLRGKGRSGGVNKRAEVVKKVMKDRGCSMIQASKIVKSEGLY